MGRAGGGRDRRASSTNPLLRALLVSATRGADAARDIDEDRRHRARLVHEAPVEQLPQAAALHRVSGSVARGLEGVDGVPDDVVRELRAAQQRSRLRHMVFIGALSEIGARFEAAGLRWLVMKGPVLTATLYDDPGDRTYGDLDLLVHRRDFPEATRQLEAMGYQHVIRNWALAQRMLAGEIPMTSGAVLADLHWNLHYDRVARRPFDLRPHEMLARARRVSLGPMNVDTFDAEDTLIALCFHAARSDGHRLVWFKDIERCLVVGGPDLDEVVRRSIEIRIAPLIGLMLARTRRILGAPVPDRIITALASGPLLRTERWICHLVDPLQFDERGTITRGFTRSIRGTDLETLLAIPARGIRLLQRRWFPPAANDTDDEREKQQYLDAVAGRA